MISQPLYPTQIAEVIADFDFSKVVQASYNHNANLESNLTMRLYNEAIMAWIQDLIIIDGRPVICIKSTPLRAFSKYRDMLVRTNFDAIPADSDDINRFPLPFSNFTRGMPKENKTQQVFGTRMRNLGFLDVNKRRTATARYPKTFLLPYTIDFWCRYESHMDYIIQRIWEQFVPLAYTTVRSPFATEGCTDGYTCAIHKMDLQDASDLERNDTDDRLLRATLTIEVEGLMFYDITQAPTYQIKQDTLMLPINPVEPVAEGETINDDDYEAVTEISTKLTDLAPLTLAEIEASTSPDVPSLIP